MRLALAITLLSFAVATLLAADSYLKTESHPRLRIKSVQKPEKKSQPLELALELSCEGKTMVAVSQEQFSIHIYTDQQPYLFVGDASFPTNAPRVFTVKPQKSSTLSVTTSTNHLRDGKSWSDLPPGIYTLRVYIGSGKTPQFDYQWLGQTYSDDYKLVIK